MKHIILALLCAIMADLIRRYWYGADIGTVIILMAIIMIVYVCTEYFNHA